MQAIEEHHPRLGYSPAQNNDVGIKDADNHHQAAPQPVSGIVENVGCRFVALRRASGCSTY